MLIQTQYIQILTYTRTSCRSQNICCQVTEQRHKGVKRKGNRTNRNPATAGFSIMTTELEGVACERMAQALDESGTNACICLYLHVSCMNLSVCVCINSDFNCPRSSPGPRWHKRRRTEPVSPPDESSVSSDSDDILPASRHWARNPSGKTEGSCMADGLRCSVWGRAQSAGTVSLSLIKGWARVQMATRGNLALAMEDLAWTAGSHLPKPPLLSQLPMLLYLPNKLVHFLLDYHPRWIARLGLPASDGTHRQLRPDQIQSALLRLESMPDVLAPLQLFSGVQLGHSEWRGTQNIHATPFGTASTRRVCSCICLYLHV